MITEVAKNIFQIHVTLPNNPLKEHHKLRLAETYRIVQEHPGLCPYEIAGQMTWRIRARNWEEFPPAQKWFAVGECMAHLDYLCAENKVTGELVDDIWRYRV